MVHSDLEVGFHYGQGSWCVWTSFMGSHSGHQDGGSEVQLRTVAGVEQNWIKVQPFNLTSCATF